MDKPAECTFWGYLWGIAMKIPEQLFGSWRKWIWVTGFLLFCIALYSQQTADWLQAKWKGLSPWVSVPFIVIILLYAIMRAIYEDRNELYMAYKAAEERAIKAEEKLTTKIIIYLKDCVLSSDGNLYMKLSLCNDGYKKWTIETAIIITSDKSHLLKIQNRNACLDNNYNNILNNECISSISQEDTSEYDIPFNPDDTQVITLKQLFNIQMYLKNKDIENIKKMPLGIRMRIRDYRGLQHFVDYYPCCELYIGEDGKIRTCIIHKPLEKILKEGETNIVKSWRI